jgi:hypothetical protein
MRVEMNEMSPGEQAVAKTLLGWWRGARHRPEVLVERLVVDHRRRGHGDAYRRASGL